MITLYCAPCRRTVSFVSGDAAIFHANRHGETITHTDEYGDFIEHAEELPAITSDDILDLHESWATRPYVIRTLADGAVAGGWA